MIEVLCADCERPAVEEFFQLFKVPWWFHGSSDGSRCDVLVATQPPNERELNDYSLALVFSSRPLELDAELQRDDALSAPVVLPPLYAASERPTCSSDLVVKGWLGNTRVVRCGYDLFDEVRHLLGPGQPDGNAGTPALDLHMERVREWVVEAGIPLLEIPPVRMGHRFAVCLTHDIDFVGIRRHRFDRTAGGFVWRASIGTLAAAIGGRASLRRLFRNWVTLLSLPLVHLRVLPDPWRPFDSYLEVDPAPATYFVIPFRDRAGRSRTGEAQPRRRAVNYDVTEIGGALETVRDSGSEVAVHGIDAWHSQDAGRSELARVATASGERSLGIRMHWLCFDDSYGVLDAAGFEYDATCGYNDAVGFKAGTAQVFKPLGSERLLELPLLLQDTALFFPARMRLSDEQAWARVEALRAAIRQRGGVLTISWHDRSLAPERLWDEFYERLLDAVQLDDPWFCTAREVVDWFRLRRSIRFDSADVIGGSIRVSLSANGDVAEAGFLARVHVQSGQGVTAVDIPWRGEDVLVVDAPAAHALETR